ncbi:MAG: type VI secretion system baseplate subunit TssF, partial [Chitinivibrionales bacterium]
CGKVKVGDPEPTSFTYKIVLAGEIPHSMPFSKENFRMFCTPVVNLFKHHTVPVNRSGLKTEYRVIADTTYPQSIQAHSIISVTGIDKVTGDSYDYEPLHSFKNISNKKARTYTARYQNGFDNRRAISLQIGGEQLAGEEIHEESLTIHAWCTNGDLPREEIREGGISTPGRKWPDFIMLSNITRPTLACRPPAGEDYLWMFLSHLGSTYTTLADADALKSFLRLYNWSQGEGKGRRIDAITEATAEPTQMVVQGALIRGVRFSVGIQAAQFNDSGDLHLFGEVLKEFLAQYVSVNSFVELVFVLKPSGQTMTWNSIAGRRWQI